MSKITPKDHANDWQRFERAVDIALKTPAKHRKASRKKPKKAARSSKVKAY